MKKSGYYMRILAGSIVFLNVSVCHALIPTVDATAIAEGIKSNIELVKQSKIVVEATKITGQISKTLGEVKASISELSIAELKEAEEFIEKQKENYEKAKQNYEEYKKKIEEEQALLEEGKRMLEEARNITQKTISEDKITEKEVERPREEQDNSQEENKTVSEQPMPVTDSEGKPVEQIGNSQEQNSSNTKKFRQSPSVNNTVRYDNSASVEDLVAEKYAYSVEVSERLNFAQLDEATENIPTGDNDVTGEFIISKEMALHCKININIATIDQLEDCIKKIITYRSDPDMKVAEKGDALVDKIFYENAVGTAAAAMYSHNKASHYKEEVLIPMRADSAEGQSDVRDDISVLTSAQEQVQNLLIDLTKAYAAQVYQQSIKNALQTRLKDIDPEAALAAQNEDTENSEESSGE